MITTLWAGKSFWKSILAERYYQINKPEEETDIVIEFKNNKESGLGIALPKGRVRLYQEDKDDSSLEFIGEDAIDHTPADEDVRLTIGNAFDISYDYDQVEGRKSQGYEYYKYHCSLRNHKDEDVGIRFDYNIWETWEMVGSSHE